MPELSLDWGKLLTFAAQGGWGAFAALLVLGSIVLTVYVTGKSLYKKLVTRTNAARRDSAAVRNPVDNAKDETALHDAEAAVEDTLKGG